MSYGWIHQAKRKAALQAHVEGTPCAMCGQPMYREQGLALDHLVPLVLGGRPNGQTRLVHAECNRRAGAELRWREHPSRSVNSREW